MNINTNITTYWPTIEAKSFEAIKILSLTAVLLINVFPSPLLPASNPFMQRGGLNFYLNDIITASSSPASYPLEPGTVLGVVSTAYSSDASQTDASPFTTASGSLTRQGVMAANFLPINTKVRIGHNIYTVEDRMNSRYNDTYRIDIWMPSAEQARRYGLRPQIMEIVALP